MISEEQHRMQEIFRQVKIGQELPAFLASLSKALGQPMATGAVLPLDRSEKMQQQLSERISEGLQQPQGPQHLLLPRSAQATFEAEFVRLVARFEGEMALVSLGKFGTLPLLAVKAAALAGHFDDLWQMGDTVTVASRDLERGFMADFYPNDAEQAYEIVSWGLDAWT